MKNKILKPIAIMTSASFLLFGCSASEETSTAAMEGATVSESMSTEGDRLDVLVIEETVAVPVTTLSVTALSMENTVDISDMFDDIGDTEEYKVLDLARKSPNLSTFVQLIERANQANAIERLDKATLFAPTNAAFAKMPRAKLESLLQSNNVALLARFIQAHVIAADVSSARLNENHRITISENNYIPIESTSANSIYVGGSFVAKPDIEASNGFIHVLDDVIMPSEDIRKDTELR